MISESTRFLAQPREMRLTLIIRKGRWWAGLSLRGAREAGDEAIYLAGLPRPAYAGLAMTRPVRPARCGAFGEKQNGPAQGGTAFAKRRPERPYFFLAAAL